MFGNRKPMDHLDAGSELTRLLWVMSDNSLIRECLVDKIDNSFGGSVVCRGGRSRDLDLIVASDPDLVVIDSSHLGLESGLLCYQKEFQDAQVLFFGSDGVMSVAGERTYKVKATLTGLLSCIEACLGLQRTQAAALTVVNADFTQRELEVARRLIEGKANKLIADELNLSGNTIKMYVTQIMKKLGVSNRTQAVIVLAKRHEVTAEIGAKNIVNEALVFQDLY